MIPEDPDTRLCADDRGLACGWPGPLGVGVRAGHHAGRASLKPTIVRRPGKGDPPMTPEQIRDLALTLNTIIVESHDVVAQA
jgi:hypothetical protein